MSDNRVLEDQNQGGNVYVIENYNDSKIQRGPDSLKGFNCNIADCKNTEIIITDLNCQIMVDDLEDCVLQIGPCSGSVFIRGSKNCVVHAVCKQFRISQCSNVKCFLYTNSEPAVEHCSGLEFNESAFQQPEIVDHFMKAKLVKENQQRTPFIFDEKHDCYQVDTEIATPEGLFGAVQTNWIDLVEDSQKEEEELSEEKKKQLEQEVQLRKEQEAKNKIIQQQKKQQNLNNSKPAAVVSQNSQAEKDFHRTLSGTFELKFIIRFASFFVLTWLIYIIQSGDRTNLRHFELFNNRSIDILSIVGVSD